MGRMDGGRKREGQSQWTFPVPLCNNVDWGCSKAAFGEVGCCWGVGLGPSETLLVGLSP